MKVVTILTISLLFLSCSSSTSRKVVIHQLGLPENNQWTQYWVYIGKDEYGRVLLVRLDGNLRDLEDPFYHKIPYVWSRKSWFMIPKGLWKIEVPPGSRVKLVENEFVPYKASNYWEHWDGLYPEEIKWNVYEAK